MSTKKLAKRAPNRKVFQRWPETVVNQESPFVDDSRNQEFLAEEGTAIHNFELKTRCAAIAFGEFVEFPFSNENGRVINVRNYIGHSIRSGNVEDPHLRHFIRVQIDINPNEAD